MSLWPPHLYRREGRRQGINENVLAAAIGTANAAQCRGLPAILTLKHLCVMANVPYGQVRGVIARELDAYTAFRMKKRRGGYRMIAVPRPFLKQVQRWLARNVLRKLPTHSASYAYARRRSAVDCARQHCGARWLIKLDLEQFFESISEIDVFRAFRRAGYEPLMSFELARLCTRVLPDHANASTWFGHRRRWQNTRTSWWPFNAPPGIPAYACKRIGHIPQGAPTSPMLSNLVASRIDTQLYALAQDHCLVYTRYSDDIVFSTDRSDFNRDKARAVVRHAQALLGRKGFRIQKSKTTIVPPGARKVVLGLVVNCEAPSLPREFTDEIRIHLYYAKKFGAQSHAARRGFDSLAGFYRYLGGKINFARQVDVVFGSWARAEFALVRSPS